MKRHPFFLLIFLAILPAAAQIKGVVKDSITGYPIPYVTIAVENENLTTTSEENGEFTIPISEKNKRLIFSSLGFEKKIVPFSKASEVNLKPETVQLDEVVIAKRYETRQIKIGKSDDQILQTFDNSPRMDIKFFPYIPAYKKTKYIKQVSVLTKSRIEEATFKIHFYDVAANGLPGGELLPKDFIVSVDKGMKETKFNVTKFNLRMPKEGIFVGIEKLMIEKNTEETITDDYTDMPQSQTRYFPVFLYNTEMRDFQIAFSGGKWIKQNKHNPDDPEEKMPVYEPAIYLILTN